MGLFGNVAMVVTSQVMALKKDGDSKFSVGQVLIFSIFDEVIKI